MKGNGQRRVIQSTLLFMQPTFASSGISENDMAFMWFGITWAQEGNSQRLPAFLDGKVKVVMAGIGPGDLAIPGLRPLQVGLQAVHHGPLFPRADASSLPVP
jgi:hypothetical protein